MFGPNVLHFVSVHYKMTGNNPVEFECNALVEMNNFISRNTMKTPVITDFTQRDTGFALELGHLAPVAQKAPVARKVNSAILRISHIQRIKLM